MDASNLSTTEKWDYIYASLGITDFMNYITGELQYNLLPLKIFFILFSILFLYLVMYFYVKSSYIRYHFMQNLTELVSGQAYGTTGTNTRLKNIIKKTESGEEKDFKSAIVEVDDMLRQTLEERGYQGGSFESLVESVGHKIMPNYEQILSAHEIRNSIVYDINYKLDLEKAKKILDEYEKTINNMMV